MVVLLVEFSPVQVFQEVVSVSGIQTVDCLSWGKFTLFHNMPLLLGSSVQSGWSMFADGAVVWDVCELESVSRMHTVF